MQIGQPINRATNSLIKRVKQWLPCCHAAACMLSCMLVCLPACLPACLPDADASSASPTTPTPPPPSALQPPPLAPSALARSLADCQSLACFPHSLEGQIVRQSRDGDGDGGKTADALIHPSIHPAFRRITRVPPPAHAATKVATGQAWFGVWRGGEGCTGCPRGERGHLRISRTSIPHMHTNGAGEARNRVMTRLQNAAGAAAAAEIFPFAK